MSSYVLISDNSESIFDFGPTKITNILEKMSLGIIDATHIEKFKEAGWNVVQVSE